VDPATPHRRPRCLLKALHRERGLAPALEQLLAAEVPEIEFTRSAPEGVDAAWLCGYEPGNAGLIGRLRAQYPSAVLLVTAKEPEDEWAGEALGAGADYAYAWPLALPRLARLLGRRPLQSRA
jgi:hypothetical protein